MDDKFYHGPAHGGPHFHSGPPGKRGTPGVSPTVQISELSEDGAYTITVTDAYHSESVRIPVADEDFIAERIEMWMDAHPEATTTVEDGSLTIEKLTSEAIAELKAIADGSIDIEKLSSEAVEELTTIPDESIGVGKLTDAAVAELKAVDEVCILQNPLTIDSLMDVSFADVYEMFDAYVDDGILTKSLIGYGSAASSSTEDAVDDTNLPIYMYSLASPAKKLMSYFTKNTTILVSACLHGNEKTGIPAILNFIEEWKSGNNPWVNEVVSKYNIDFIPCLNPYGVNASVGTTLATVTQYAGRRNQRNVDLNRNGDFCWLSFDSAYKGLKPKSETETKLIVSLASQDKYAYYIELHGLLDNLIFQVNSDDPVSRSIGKDVINRMAARVNELGVDFDAHHGQQDGGSYRLAVNSLGVVPYPVNEIVHNKPSAKHGCILEMQRYDEEELYPAVVQHYESEFFITYLYELADHLSKALPDEVVPVSDAENLCSFDSRDWANGDYGHDSTNEFRRGNKTRLIHRVGIPVTAGDAYEYGVLSADDDVSMNLVIKEIDGDKTEWHLLSYIKDKSVFISNVNGLAYPILAKGANRDAYVNPHSIAKSCSPYVRRITNRVSGFVTSVGTGVTLDASDENYVSVSGRDIFFRLAFHIETSAYQAGTSCQICKLKYKPFAITGLTCIQDKVPSDSVAIDSFPAAVYKPSASSTNTYIRISLPSDAATLYPSGLDVVISGTYRTLDLLRAPDDTFVPESNEPVI